MDGIENELRGRGEGAGPVLPMRRHALSFGAALSLFDVP